MIASVIERAILISLIMVPERSERRTGGSAVPEVAKVAESTMDAIVQGTPGHELLLNIFAMLIVFVALVHRANASSVRLPAVGGEPITLRAHPRLCAGAGVLADRHSLDRRSPPAG